MKVLEKHAEKSDKILFSSSSTNISISVGSQMHTSVSYLSSKQTNVRGVTNVYFSNSTFVVKQHHYYTEMFTSFLIVFFPLFFFIPAQMGRNSADGIETRYALDGPGIESRCG
jgi:hypothetical protein